MTILCSVNQTECLRYGIDAPSSTVKIEVDPKSLSQEQRDFLADQLYNSLRFPNQPDYNICPPTYEGLLAAISYGMKCEQYDQETESHEAGASMRKERGWRKEAITQAIQDMEARLAKESKKAKVEKSAYSQSNPDPAQFEDTLKLAEKRR